MHETYRFGAEFLENTISVVLVGHSSNAVPFGWAPGVSTAFFVHYC